MAPRSKHIPVQHKKGSCLPIDDEWSVHDCWIIEHTPKDPHYGIPKRIEYIEKGTFNLIDWYLYDKKGELWKNFTMPFIRVSEIGTVADMTGGCWAYDYQTGHHTLVGARQQTVDAGLRRDSFTVTNILRVSKGQQSFR